MEQIRHVFHRRQHMLLDEYEVYHYKDSRELHVSLHFHDFYECFLLLSGDIQYQIESASFSIHPGDLLLIGPNQLHRPLYTQTSEPYERLVLWLSRSFVEQLSTPETDLSACFSTPRLSANRLFAEQRESITQQFFALLDATRSEQFGRDVLCRSLVTSLLVTLNRALTGREHTLPRADVRVSVLVKTISNYLDTHLFDHISLDMLSQTMFLSKYYLERVFQRETGVSIYRMLLKKRMIRARDLMLEGSSLTLAAQRCGFSEYSGFYKAFKNEYGISPREYLSQNADR